MPEPLFPTKLCEELKKEIAEFLRSELSHYTHLPWSDQLLEMLSVYCAGGKQVRGGTFIQLAELLGQTLDSTKRPDHHTLLMIGVAIEVFGSAILIHDDILDQDELRRGKATVHTQFARWAENYKLPNSPHLGNSAAIVVGDILLFLTNKALISGAQVQNNPQLCSQLLHWFYRQALFTGFGELHDCLGTPDRANITPESISQLYKTKTAHYTFGTPLTLAGLITGQPSSVINKLETIGETIGVIYQIKDDEIGLFGDSAVTGKAVGADIRENKKGLHYWHAQSTLKTQHRMQDLAFLESAYGSKNLNAKDLDKAIKLIADTGAKLQLQREMEQLAKKVEQSIGTLDFSSEVHEWFKRLLTFNLERVK